MIALGHFAAHWPIHHVKPGSMGPGHRLFQVACEPEGMCSKSKEFKLGRLQRRRDKKPF